MLRKIVNLLKKIILAGFVLYGYNLMAAPLNLLIPINIVTILLICLFGIPTIPFLALLLIVIFR